MEITTEHLQERLNEFHMQRDEHIGNLGAVNGAIQFCNYLIEQLENESNGEGETSPQED